MAKRPANRPLPQIETSTEKKNRIVAAIKRDIESIGFIYPSVGQAMYDEPKDRLALRIATQMLAGDYR